MPPSSGSSSSSRLQYSPGKLQKGKNSSQIGPRRSKHGPLIPPSQLSTRGTSGKRARSPAPRGNESPKHRKPGPQRRRSQPRPGVAPPRNVRSGGGQTSDGGAGRTGSASLGGHPGRLLCQTSSGARTGRRAGPRDPCGFGPGQRSRKENGLVSGRDDDSTCSGPASGSASIGGLADRGAPRKPGEQLSCLSKRTALTRQSRC